VANPPFSVTIQAGFDHDGIWAIDGRVTFTDGLDTKSPFFGQGRRAVLDAILQAERRGRALGALWVRVHMEVGSIVKHFDVGQPLSDTDDAP
jgi:hypothetical protein